VEAVLTVGGPIHEFEKGHVDAVVVVGPHECMPCKIAEGRFSRIGEKLGLPYLALYMGGDGSDIESIDRFAFDLKERHRLRTVGTAKEDEVRNNVLTGGSGIFGVYPDERLAARE